MSNPISTISFGHNASQQAKITQIPSGQAAHSGVASSCRVMGRGDNPRNAELIQMAQAGADIASTMLLMLHCSHFIKQHFINEALRNRDEL